MKKVLSNLFNAVVLAAASALVLTFAACSDAVLESNEVAGSVSSAERALNSTVGSLNGTVRLNSYLDPGYGSAVYFTGSFDGANNWNVAYRGSYFDGHWYCDVPNGDFEWKCLTGSWSLGEKVYAPYNGLVWEAGENKVNEDFDHAFVVDFTDEEGLKKFYDFSDLAPGMEVTLNVERKIINQKATVGGVEFIHTTDYETWLNLFSYVEARECSRLFWKCYPAMYLRLANKDSYKQVNLHFRGNFKNPAGTGGNDVDLNQVWKSENPYDFDCLTHEYGHVLQNIKEDFHSPYLLNPNGTDNKYFVEIFADVVRAEYSIDNGYYNNKLWKLNTVYTQNSCFNNVRFFVWIDYTYSTKENDILQKLNKSVKDMNIPSEAFYADGEIWKICFKGTGAEGKSLSELWNDFYCTQFPWLNAVPADFGQDSDLEKAYNIRATLKKRYGC